MVIRRGGLGEEEKALGDSWVFIRMLESIKTLSLLLQSFEVAEAKKLFGTASFVCLKCNDGASILSEESGGVISAGVPA